MSMFNKLDRLKKKAARHYKTYHALCDQMSCGAFLAEHVSSQVSHAKSEFNRVMDEIAELDPNCPEGRL